MFFPGGAGILGYTLLPRLRDAADCEVTIVGTNGDDVIDGTNGNDVITGLGGNDVIRGADGEDVICGGPGDDELVSEDATSTVDMDGGHGGDSCVGGAITSNCEP